VILVSQGAALVFGAILVLGLGVDPPAPRRILYALATGVVGFVGLSAFYRGLQVGSMGVIAPIAATAVIVPVALGIARGERPSALQAAGAALALLGVVAASLEPSRDAPRGRRMASGVGLALVAALAFGGALVGLQAASKGSPLWTTLLTRVSTVPLVAAFALAVGARLADARPHWPMLVAIGTADSLGVILFGAATNRGLLSVVSVLGSLYPIVVVTLARLLLSERLGRSQLAGAVAALAGVALISAA
jgi:drug/metabolite transporter (DMT)-like permease